MLDVAAPPPPPRAPDPLILTRGEVVPYGRVDEQGSDQRTWSVGELARLCGVTVRALHHFERLGLVVASGRTAAGHRRYSEEDLGRLYRALALRALGLPLGTIVDLLGTDTELDLTSVLHDHLGAVDREIDRLEQLRLLLATTVDRLERTGRAVPDDLVQILEAMRMYEGHLSTEQVSRLERQRRESGYAGIETWRSDAEQAIAALRAAHAAGASPADPEVQRIVRRLSELKHQLMGTDRDISQALKGVHGDTAWDDLRAIVPDDVGLRSFWKQASAALS